MIHYSKKTQSKISRGERLVKSRRSQVQAPKSLLPMKSHRMCLFPPALNCDNMCKVSTRRSYRFVPNIFIDLYLAAMKILES